MFNAVCLISKIEAKPQVIMLVNEERSGIKIRRPRFFSWLCYWIIGLEQIFIYVHVCIYMYVDADVHAYIKCENNVCKIWTLVFRMPNALLITIQNRSQNTKYFKAYSTLLNQLPFFHCYTILGSTFLLKSQCKICVLQYNEYSERASKELIYPIHKYSTSAEYS